jgi:spermidine synthase
MLPWGFVLASKKHDPLGLTPDEVAHRLETRGVRGLRYYDPHTHFALFAIPPYLREVIQTARVLTDAEPFAWEA